MSEQANRNNYKQIKIALYQFACWWGIFIFSIKTKFSI